MSTNISLSESVNHYLNEIFTDESIDIISELPIINEDKNLIIAYELHISSRNKYYFLLVMNDLPRVMIEIDEKESLSSVIYKFINTWIPNYLIDL